MRSMTGFGQSSAADSSRQVAVTLRTVNSRYLDPVLRLKEEYRGLESWLRERLGREIHRGRLEATIEIRTLVPLPAAVEVQSEAVLALHRASHELAEKGLIARELSVGDLLALPGVVELRVETDQLDAAGESLLEEQVEAALTQLVASREAEGEQIRALLDQRLGEIQRILERLQAGVVDALVRAEARLQRRLETLLQDRELDPGRFALEVAILADKSDVSEELERLMAHLEAFGVAIGSQGPIGRRLDFLIQEMLREFNTLGSKARDSELTPHVLEAKLVCEQLREQVQNVE